MVKLPDPKKCPRCEQPGRVLEAREVPGYIRRRRECATCMVEKVDGGWKPFRWNSYETLVNPHDIDPRAIDLHR